MAANRRSDSGMSLDSAASTITRSITTTRDGDDYDRANKTVTLPGVSYIMAGLKEPSIEEVMVRQLNENILAYKYDLGFCEERLRDLDLTSQETRSLQLRKLDLNHQVRHCQHRIETLNMQLDRRRLIAPPRPDSRAVHRGGYFIEQGGTDAHWAKEDVKRTSKAEVATPARPAPSEKRRVRSAPRPQTPGSSGGNVSASRGEDKEEQRTEGADAADGTSSLRRLGAWRCRLCLSAKYRLAGLSRVPATPCKAPLQDVPKMISHYTEKHTEHTPAERCMELGAALKANRGPFEYWLRRTHAQRVGDGSMIDACIDSLLAGELPLLLVRLSRAAATMRMT